MLIPASVSRLALRRWWLCLWGHTVAQEVMALPPDSPRSFPAPALSPASGVLHHCGSQSKSHCSSSVSYLEFKAAQHFLEDSVSISSQLVLRTSKESFEPGQGLAGMNTVLLTVAAMRGFSLFSHSTFACRQMSPGCLSL